MHHAFYCVKILIFFSPNKLWKQLLETCKANKLERMHTLRMCVCVCVLLKFCWNCSAKVQFILKIKCILASCCVYIIEKTCIEQERSTYIMDVKQIIFFWEKKTWWRFISLNLSVSIICKFFEDDEMCVCSKNVRNLTNLKFTKAKIT